MIQYKKVNKLDSVNNVKKKKNRLTMLKKLTSKLGGSKCTFNRDNLENACRNNVLLKRSTKTSKFSQKFCKILFNYI